MSVDESNIHCAELKKPGNFKVHTGDYSTRLMNKTMFNMMNKQ